MQTPTIPELLERVRKGDAEARCLLAVELVEGRRIQPDFWSAMHLVQQAVLQEFPAAMVLLAAFARQAGLEPAAKYWEARVQNRGPSTPAYEAELLRYATDKAAKLSGAGPEARLEEMLSDLENGSVEDIISVAEFYDFGIGVPLSYDKSMQLWEKAAATGDANAQFHTGVRYLADYVANKGIKEAIEVLEKAAAQGDARAMNELSKIYLNPHAGFVNPERGMNYLKRAAGAGDKRAQYTLGMVYFHGRGITRDLSATFDWISKSAAQNFPAALYQLSWMLGTGTGVEKDLASAERLLKQAAELGDAQARDILARKSGH